MSTPPSNPVSSQVAPPRRFQAPGLAGDGLQPALRVARAAAPATALSARGESLIGLANIAPLRRGLVEAGWGA
jgi:hypothetical protein